MRLLELDTYIGNTRLLGAITITISLVAWGSEFAHLVYVCPYCRVQRTVIGILGLIMILPRARHWLSRYVATVFAVFGLVVGASQHFTQGWMKVSAGDFVWHTPWYIDSFVLSGVAMFIMTAQLSLLFAMEKK